MSMDPRQESAFLGLLRVVADGELAAEQLRCRLCEAHGFDPYEVFKNLQGNWYGQKGWLGAHDLHRWLGGQPHSISSISFEDVASLMAIFEMSPGELRFDGFLRMVMPKDPSNGWLKDLAMSRSSKGTWDSRSVDGKVLPEVAYNLCLLLESELEVLRHLKFHRKHLMDLGVTKFHISRFCGCDPVTASLGGLVSQATFRFTVVDNLGALSHGQCDALLRRINPAGSCLVQFDDISKVLVPGLVSSIPSLSTTARARASSPYRSLSPHRATDLNTYRRSHDMLATPQAWKEPHELSFTPEKLSPRSRSANRAVDWRQTSFSADYEKDVSRGWSPSRCSLALAEPSGVSFSPLRDSPRPTSWMSPKVPDLRCPGLGSSKVANDDVRPYSASRHRSLGISDHSSFLRSSSPASARALRPSIDPLVSSLNELKDWRAHIASKVLNVMAQQANLDTQAEASKDLLPTTTCLEAIFNMLDRFHKGYITDTDLYQYSKDFGGTAGHAQFTALIHEVFLRRPRESFAIPGRMTLRDLSTLVSPIESQEHEASLSAKSDDEFRSILYLLRHTEPCPQCGFRVQRDADAAGCPTVTCPNCGATFRCFAVVGDFHNSLADESTFATLPVASQYHLFRVLDTSVRVADDLEQDRRHLGIKLRGNEGGIGMLSTAFAHVGEGRTSFLMGDLRRAMSNLDIYIPEQQLGLLWYRYSPRPGIEVTFSDLVRQLKSRESYF